MCSIVYKVIFVKFLFAFCVRRLSTPPPIKPSITVTGPRSPNNRNAAGSPGPGSAPSAGGAGPYRVPPANHHIIELEADSGEEEENGEEERCGKELLR